MKASVILWLSVLFIVLDVASCARKPVRQTDPPTEMTDDRIFEVKGTIFSIYFEDLNKSSKVEAVYTNVSFWVEESKNLADPDKKLRENRISMKRPKKEGDDKLKEGEVYTFKIGVNEVGGSTYYYWLD